VNLVAIRISVNRVFDTTFNQSINQSISQSINQSINQSLFANAISSKQQKKKCVRLPEQAIGNRPTKLATLGQKDRQT